MKLSVAFCLLGLLYDTAKSQNTSNSTTAQPLSEAATTTKLATTTKVICPFKTDPTNIHRYMETFLTGTKLSHPCSTGTKYSDADCICISDPKYQTGTTSGCQPVADYNFDTDLQDHSSNKVASSHVNVYVTGRGTARFVRGGRIIIWRFPGADFRKSLQIAFSFKTDPQMIRRATIFTNINMWTLGLPSLSGIVRMNKIILSITTQFRRQELSFYMNPGFNHVVMNYDGNTFHAEVNGVVKDAPLTGNVARRCSPFIIGDFGGTSVSREMDYFKIYMCKPEV